MTESSHGAVGHAFCKPDETIGFHAGTVISVYRVRRSHTIPTIAIPSSATVAPSSGMDTPAAVSDQLPGNVGKSWDPKNPSGNE